MAQPSWTIEDGLEGKLAAKPRTNKLKFVFAAVIMVAAVIFLISKAISTEGQFFITIEEYYANPAKYSERDVRISAWVDGDTIQFEQIDAQTSRLEFDIVDDLSRPGQVMHVVAFNEPLPDLLQHEAQAIVEGHINADGHLQANPSGLLLKCPTRYEEGVEGSYE